MEAVYENISVDRVRDIIRSHHEQEYLVVDVRQPHEYLQGHIPGAALFPLGELAARAGELPSDKKLVMYCRSGKRSRAAATLIGANRTAEQPALYNMDGGMLAWDGMVLSGMPDLKSFLGAGTVHELFTRAMELERGAERFYQSLLERLKDERLQRPLRMLARAEEAHARLLHRHWAARDEGVASFTTVYQGLTGDIVEGNLPVDQLFDVLTENTDNPCLAAMEMAVYIECTAYDMYRHLAQTYGGTELEKVFLEIAQAEKSHIQVAAEAISCCPETGGR